MLTVSAVTERARKLRANYNIHAQSLRTRVEIRVNRIPLSLRKLTMGELQEKYSTGEQQKQGVLEGPPVPAKDGVSRPPITRGPGTAASSSKGPVKRRRFVATPSTKQSNTLTNSIATKSQPETRRMWSRILKPPIRGSAQTRRLGVAQAMSYHQRHPTRGWFLTTGSPRRPVDPALPGQQ